MRSRIFGLQLLMLLTTTTVWGQSRLGTWKADLVASRFGAEGPPRGMTLKISVDNSTHFAYSMHVAASDGDFIYRWTGPKNGSMHKPIVLRGGPHPGAEEGWKDIDGRLISHGVEVDGSLETSSIRLSDQGRVLILDVAWIHYDGSEEKQQWLFRRQ